MWSQFFQTKRTHSLHHSKTNRLCKINTILRIQLGNIKVYSLEASCLTNQKILLQHFYKNKKTSKIYNQLILKRLAPLFFQTKNIILKFQKLMKNKNNFQKIWILLIIQEMFQLWIKISPKIFWNWQNLSKIKHFQKV